MPNLSDEQLMNLVLAKERFALEELYTRYVKLVYSFALRSTSDEEAAKEIVQLVFTRLWTTQKGFDPGKGRFVNWILTITRNMTVDYIRRQRRHQEAAYLEDGEWERLPGSMPDPADAASLRELREQMTEACRNLSESQAQLIEHVYWKGYTLSEVAAMKQEPLGTIKSRLHQSLKQLRRHFAGKEG